MPPKRGGTSCPRSGTVAGCAPRPGVGRTRSDRAVPALVRRGGRRPRGPARCHDARHRHSRRSRLGPHRAAARARRTRLRVLHESRERQGRTSSPSNPRAALVFHWREQERQVRVVGPVRRVDDADAARYWESRPRGHRVSAWASPQSEVVDRAELEARVAEVEVAVRRPRSAVAAVLGRVRRRGRRARMLAGAARSPARPRALPPRRTRRLAARAARAVNAATAGAFVVAALFAIGDWIAKARSRTRARVPLQAGDARRADRGRGPARPGSRRAHAPRLVRRRADLLARGRRAAHAAAGPLRSRPRRVPRRAPLLSRRLLDARAVG